MDKKTNTVEKTQGVKPTTTQKKVALLKPVLAPIDEFMKNYKSNEKLVTTRRTLKEHLNKIEKLSDVDHGDLDQEKEDYFIKIGYNGSYNDSYKITNQNLLEKIVALLNSEISNKITEIDTQLLG